MITALTFLAVPIHGYHPYSEDGGLYAAGIKRLLDPTLYPHSSAFVVAHLRFSLFAPAIATVTRLTHLGLPTVLFLLHLITIWTTLFAVWLLAERCYSSRLAHIGAVSLLATWLTIPVAGTSLILMDPYLTARSISLPCTLLALVAAIDFARPLRSGARPRSILACLSMLALAALAHPLMATYALGDVLLLTAFLARNRTIRIRSTVLLCLFAVSAASILYAIAQPDSPAYAQVAMTRYYWFLSQWQWYEVLGLVAPLIILSTYIFFGRSRSSVARTDSTRQAVAKMGITSGLVAITISLFFAHASSSSYIVARLQPLRAFQVIYIVMILLLGATLGERLLKQHPARWLALFPLLAVLMFTVQRSTYPSSAHIEWPNAVPSNQWQQAFLWISRNTPKDALFAMDADYISAPGEDAQSFRAIAERSALPDYSKDGGEASITPDLTAAWVDGQRAQSHLSTESDAARISALYPFKVSWIILQQNAQTALRCPYENARVRVCRLP